LSPFIYIGRIDLSVKENNSVTFMSIDGGSAALSVK
jgi:hypothetical protein